MSKRRIIFLILLAVVFGGIVAYNTIRSYMVARYFSSFKAPAVTVSTVKAQLKNWQPVFHAVGNFVATEGIEINAQAGGIVKEILFESGQEVKQGDPLIVIDDSVEQATLKNDQANLVLQKLNFARQAKLMLTGSTSSSDRDKARADLDSAEASVQKTQALIAQKHITAPFDGKLGIRKISLGQYIAPGQTEIVTLQALNPLYLQFYLPEDHLLSLYANQPIQFQVEALPERVFPGKIVAVNSKVDNNTHNILVQAIVENERMNKHFIFLPGMFAKIDVLLPQQEKVIVLPLTAVTYSLYGDSVYRVEKDKVYRQFVKTGDKKGNEVVILSGVKEGDIIVTAGQMKLHNGTQVAINNTINLK